MTSTSQPMTNHTQMVMVT